MADKIGYARVSTADQNPHSTKISTSAVRCADHPRPPDRPRRRRRDHRPLRQRPDGFALARAWEQVVSEVERRRSQLTATPLVEDRFVPVLRTHFGRHCHADQPGPNGRARVRVAAGRSGRALQSPLDTFVPVAAATVVGDLVLRYLAAFGPATVRDVQQWCGLTKLAEVVDGLRDRLVTFTDEHGPDYDNLLLSHADRSRVDAGVDFGAQGFGPDSMEQPSSLLVDGTVAATWKVTRTRGAAALTVRPFRPLTAAERDAVADEGAGLLAFLHPRDDHDVRITPPGTPA